MRFISDPSNTFNSNRTKLNIDSLFLVTVTNFRQIMTKIDSIVKY